MGKDNYSEDELKKAESDPEIIEHLKKVKDIKSECENIKAERNLTARVMLRNTGAIRGQLNSNPNSAYYQIQESDLFAWFHNGDHLRKYKETDTL